MNAEDLPRRTAHAVAALFDAQDAQGPRVMPLTAAEVMLYDPEAYSPRDTGAALAHARKLGLVIYTGRYWTNTFYGGDLKAALQDRLLRETTREGEGD